MLKRLFQRPQTPSTDGSLASGRPPMCPRGVHVYAVGDIHGRLDLLVAMESLIEADRREHARYQDTLIVHLGDMVDRGPDSRRVLDHMIAHRRDRPPRVLLLGNHDLWLREFVAVDAIDFEQATSWMRYGGDTTLLSYGVKIDPRLPERERLDGAQRELQERFPPEHAALLAELDLAFSFGDYFFCHAGVRPDVPLHEQGESDLLWIREPFLSWTGNCGKIVIHGHTVQDVPIVRSNRIGIDTGACWTGRLTCLVLSGAERRFLQTGR